MMKRMTELLLVLVLLLGCCGMAQGEESLQAGDLDGVWVVTDVQLDVNSEFAQATDAVPNLLSCILQIKGETAVLSMPGQALECEVNVLSDESFAIVIANGDFLRFTVHGDGTISNADDGYQMVMRRYEEAAKAADSVLDGRWVVQTAECWGAYVEPGMLAALQQMELSFDYRKVTVNQTEEYWMYLLTPDALRGILSEDELMYVFEGSKGLLLFWNFDGDVMRLLLNEDGTLSFTEDGTLPFTEGDAGYEGFKLTFIHENASAPETATSEPDDYVAALEAELAATQAALTAAEAALAELGGSITVVCSLCNTEHTWNDSHQVKDIYLCNDCYDLLYN